MCDERCPAVPTLEERRRKLATGLIGGYPP
jgi:hypothetical protein